MEKSLLKNLSTAENFSMHSIKPWNHRGKDWQSNNAKFINFWIAKRMAWLKPKDKLEENCKHMTKD